MKKSASGSIRRWRDKLAGLWGRRAATDEALAIGEQAIPSRILDTGAPEASAQNAPAGEAIAVALPVCIEIHKQDGAYTGVIHQDNRESAFALPELHLDRHVKALADRPWTLGNLVDAIINFKHNDLKAFDERVQLDLGQYLYDQTLGHLPAAQQRACLDHSALDVRILTDEEWIARLPWNLLAHQGLFRCANGWSVAVCGHWRAVDCALPPSPRLLVVAAQPAGVRATRAEDHLEDLEDMLASHDPQLSLGNNLRVACTWEDFVQQVADFRPHLIYYYGHGVGDSRKTRLVFATNDNKRIDKPLADFAHCLRQLDRPPLLAYVNCCLGDAGGFLGAGAQLGDFIPAVITNRTVTKISVAQAQALSLWKRLLIHAVPPHRAVAELALTMDVRQLSLADIRWITPVLHAHYRQWQATPPTPPDRLTRDPHWHLKIDRVSQYNAVIAQTSLMLREQKPKSLVFTWYGQEGQGIEIFHRRLWVELREALSNVFVYQVRPAWPLHLDNYHTSFSDMLTQTFGVNTLEDIPARIRAESHGAFGKQTLVYIRHEPVRSTQLINPESLREYVAWWDATFIPLLERTQFALLGVSFIVNNPPAFVEYVEDEQIEELDTKNTVFWLLNEMEKVAKKDLLLFLRTHNIDLPGERRDQVLQKILRKTGGQYEQTIAALKQLRQEAWRVRDARGAKEKTQKKKFDY